MFNISPSLLLAKQVAPDDGVLYEDVNGRNEDTYDKTKCPEPPPFDIEKYKMGLVLRVKTGELVDGIIQKERAQGRTPKVLLIARAGQDMSGAAVLKDEDQGRVLSVADIMEGAIGLRVNPYPGGSGARQSDIHFDQKAIKAKYKDATRKLTYSHLGLLIIDDPFIKTRKDLTKAERAAIVKRNEMLRKNNLPVPEEKAYNGGQYWVRELLKPCESMQQHSWRTGLSGFFQDDPFEFKSIVMVPDQKIQDLIYSFLIDHGVESDANYKKFLADNYNIAANFKDPVDQNSNQFFLEVVAAAMLARDKNISINKTSRPDYLKYLEQTGYRPTKILPESFWLKQATSPIAGWFMDTLNIRDSDHPFARPYGITEIVTELSIREYLLRRDVVGLEGIHHVVINPEDIKRVNVKPTALTNEKK